MSDRLPRITCQELIKALKKAGFEEKRQSGSHLRLYHPIKKNMTTVAVHKGEIIRPGTLSSILNDADMTVDQLKSLL